jgi:rare lipoprotein A
MASKSDPPGALRSLSVRQLILIFFGAVGVCAVFFALGFLVGSNGRTPNPSASEIPPTVNQPLESSDSGATSNSKSQTPAVIEQDLKPTSVSPTSASSPPQRTSPTTPSSTPTAAMQRVEEESTEGKVMVQVAATHTEQDAQSLVKTLTAHGYHVRLVTPQQSGARDNLYRVQVGPFASRQQALPTLHKLSREGFRPFIRE